MPEPHWMSYAGFVSGIVGSLAGIAGTVLGIISYRKASKIKTLDLRLEYRKEIGSLRSETEALMPLLEEAKTLRENVAAAIGKFKSGETRLWLDEYGVDKESVQEIAKTLPDMEKRSSTNEQELEESIIEAHAYRTTIRLLEKKYQDSMVYDYKRADRHSDIVQAQLKR